MTAPETTARPPTIGEFLEYAEGQILFYIKQYGQHLNQEQHEEAAQDARLRLFKAFNKLDSSKGWKAFIQKHCFGAVSDYYRRGRGFQEWKWILKSKKEGDGEILHARESGPVYSEGASIESILNLQPEGEEAFYDPYEDENLVDMDLLSRLCSKSEDLRFFVMKVICGISDHKLSVAFGLHKKEIKQRIELFIEKLRAPENHGEFIAQVIFALGLSSKFGIENQDNGFGWDLEPVDLFKVPSEVL